MSKMASGGSFQLPGFEEFIKGETSYQRPAPKINDDLSLNGALHAPKNGENHRKHHMSEPRRKMPQSSKSRESGFSSEGSASEKRRRTPMTMPRTKVTSKTPLEQKIALKKLKQRLNFEDEKEDNQSSENVDATYVAVNEMDAVSISSAPTSEIPDSDISEFNTEKLKSRLNQVRVYLKEATSMYVSLSISGLKEEKQTEQMNKLAKLIQQLRIQEKGYLDLLQKSEVMDETTSLVDTASIASFDVQSIHSNNEESYQSNMDPDTLAQQQELERLKEQQVLLKKIVQQQKELQQLKERQATLLQMQEDAELLMQQQRKHNSIPNNQQRVQPNPKTLNTVQQQQPKQRLLTDENNENDVDVDANQQKQQELEKQLMALQDKKEQMDTLLEMLKTLRDSSQANEGEIPVDIDMRNQVVSSHANANGNIASNEELYDDMDVQEKINKLNDVRERLQELRTIVTNYESGNIASSAHSTDEPRDNRVHARAMQQKQGNTITGQGGARLRLPSRDFLINDLQALQNGIEELMDNRRRPVPHSKQKIDVTRNSSSPTVLRAKNTNQEKNPVNRKTKAEVVNGAPSDYLEKMRELQLARHRLSNDPNYSDYETNSIQSTQTEEDRNGGTENDTDVESVSSSNLQWQEDPEFQSKVKKLQIAKEKLHHLQQLVRAAQQNGGPELPIDDLVDLTLTISDDQNDISGYGESEEEVEDEDDDDDETAEEDQNDDVNNEDEGEEDCPDGEEEKDDEQSEVSKSTDVNFNFAPENGLSDNERRYQGLLRKQRLELNYLLKERERLLEAQQKLSTLATTATATSETQTRSAYVSSQQGKTKSSSTSSKKGKSTNGKAYPVLTQAELNKQDKYKNSSNDSFALKMNGMSGHGHYGSEHEIYPPSVELGDQAHFQTYSGPLSNPMAVSEIRRQRELFEQKKKQKFVENQRRKRKNRSDENQSDDRATYSVHSDIDEGVGISMYSADVTTAATWGGSTEQSSSEEDSAVGEDYPVSSQIDHVGDDYEGSQFDQPVEGDDDVDGVNNVPSIFKVKKYDEQPRRGISWLNDVTPKKKTSYPRGGSGGSVSWSLDVSPPRSRRKMRQGNLTPAHKLIQDNKRKRLRQNSTDENTDGIDQSQQNGPSELLQTQLASMCTSLLRNEQTLLSMLQSQTTNSGLHKPNGNPVANSSALDNIQEYFQTSNYKKSYEQTLESLKLCFERVEQQQLDLEYLRQQFSRLNTSAAMQPEAAATAATTDYRSPWPNPPSLHLSAFGNPDNTMANDNVLQDLSAQSCIKPQSRAGAYQKATQTESGLCEELSSIQPYTLFGEVTNDINVTPTRRHAEEEFNFDPVLNSASPGTIGQRNISHDFHQLDNANELAANFPFRLRMSEYNPISYQGNFANTKTGNVITMSRMSLNKDHAETFVSDHGDKSIWPSFFKLNNEVSATADNNSERSSKYTSSLAGHSGANEILAGSPSKAADELAGASGGSNFSLFEALRDSIYSEVATLIAMNESRPHYLIELFRELQLLNSDYLRQRALYSLQELVTRFLTEENLSTSPNKSAFKQETVPARPSYEQWVASASEQTPSESGITTDGDESETHVLQTLSKQIQNNEIYDYAELADIQSDNMSTPGSHGDFPFAADDLGNTVINLDEALDRMKIYEQGMANARKAFGLSAIEDNASPRSVDIDPREAAYDAIKQRINIRMETTSESSVCDVTSETSSDMPQPSVDTQKLDRQIKAVMMDLIPFLNDRIESACNEELLNEIRSLVVKFAKEKEPGSGKEEFGRFFHSQLDSILKDSLLKFQGRKLKECGEDILIDVSEILFNELAFFRLMQDLDRPLYTEASNDNVTSQRDNSNSSATATGVLKKPEYDESLTAESESTVENNSNTQTNSPASSASSNAYVVVERPDITDEETESSRQFVNVELSASESKPIRSSGSGEDDTDEEPSQFSKVSTPASSINLYSQVVGSQSQSNPESNPLENRIPVYNTENDGAEGDPDPEDEQSEHEREADIDVVESESAEDERDTHEEAEGSVIEQPNAEGQQPTMSQQLETDDVEEDDLPEADMIADENLTEQQQQQQQQQQAVQVVLAHLEGQQELAGDSSHPPPG